MTKQANMSIEKLFVKHLQKSKKAQSLFKKHKVNIKTFAGLNEDLADNDSFVEEFANLETEICRGLISKEYNKIAKSYPKPDRASVPQEKFLSKSKFSVKDVEKFFGSYEVLKRAAVHGINPDTDVYTRESIVNKVDHKSKSGLFFLSAAVAGQTLNVPLFNTVQNFCKVTGAELRILPVRGVKKGDELYPIELHDFMDKFYTEIKFNSNLTAIDMMLYPQQQLPLTGFDRYAQGKSIIIASPKQQLKFVPVSNIGLPHIAHTTGAITNPDNYAHTRAGAMAAKDHKIGGLIIQVVDSKVFHVRQVQVNEHGGFQHLGKYYEGSKVDIADATAVVIPDYHCGFHDDESTSAWFRLVDEVKPKYVIFHDLFDGYSISHHHDDDIYTQVNRPSHVKTLELELKCVADELLKWQKHTKAQLVIVKSNHDEVIEKWLKKGKWKFDRENYNVGLRLANYYVTQQRDPLECYLRDVHNVKNVRFLQRTEEFKLEGVHLGYHGDKGPNGTRGGAKSLSAVLGDCVIGHFHCLTLAHSVLTFERGWVNIDDVKVGERALSFDSVQQRNVWTPVVTKNKFLYEGMLFEIGHRSWKQEVTDEHMMFLEDGKYLNIMDAIKHENVSKIPLSAYPADIPKDEVHIDIPDDTVRLIVAVCADGSFEKKTNAFSPPSFHLRFHLKRERKIKRLESLLEQFDFSPVWGKKSATGSIKCTVSKGSRAYEEIIKYVDPDDKQLPRLFKFLPLRQKEILLEELNYWDGTHGLLKKESKSRQFATVKPEEANLVSSIITSLGYRSTLNIRKSDAYNNGEAYIVSYNSDRTFKTMSKRKSDGSITKWHVVPRKVKNVEVACISTEFKNFWVRHDATGQVSLTGNSPSITHDAWVVGTNSYLSRDYTAGSPSSWFHTACVLYRGGQRTLISSVFGKYK